MLSQLQFGQVRIGERDATISGSGEDGQVSLRILETAAEFEELREVWSGWTAGPEADLDYFSIHLRHRQEAVRPHVMVLYRNGRPDCMLVGRLDQGTAAFKVGPFAIFRSDARILRFVNGGFLGNQSRGNSRILLREIMGFLERQEAQAAEFSQLRADSPLYELAKREPSFFCRDHFTPLQTHRYLTVPASMCEFLHGLSNKRRKEFRRQARILERDFPGAVRFESVRSERDAEALARKANEISRKTYKHAIGVGFVNDLESREMLRTAAQKGALRACLLYVGEQPIAFAVGILSNQTLYGTFTGYDPGFSKYCPGLQAIIRLIQESFEPNGGYLRCDAGCGDTYYKRVLFGSSWKEAPVWIFAPCATGLRLHLLKVVSTLLHHSTMRLLAKSDRLRKVKKMWHRRALREFQLRSSGQSLVSVAEAAICCSNSSTTKSF